MADMLISGGRVLDLDGDVARPPVADILIQNGRITAVGAQAQNMAPDGITRRDAAGKLLIPGLVNAHYHSHDTLLRGLFEQMPLDIWVLYSAPGNFSPFTGAEIQLRTLIGAVDCLLGGITTVQDMVSVVGTDNDHVDQILAGYDASGLRVSLGLQIADKTPAESVPFWDEIDGQWGERLQTRPDPAPLQSLIETCMAQSRDRVTWALAPSAPQRCSDDLLLWVQRVAQQTGAQVFTHLYEARNQAVLARRAYPDGSLLSHLDRFGLLGPNLTIAHGVWITDAELQRFGAAGAAMVCNPASNLKLLNGVAPVRGYADHGATVALGCDNCSGNDAQNLFESMKLFALNWGMQSEPGETSAARAAFHAATLGGAKALGLAGEVGALRPGYRGDVVALDLASPAFRPLNHALNQLVYSETGTGLRDVIVGGKLLVQDGRLIDHDARDLAAAVEDARQKRASEIAEIAARNAQITPRMLDAYRRADKVALEIDRYRFNRPTCC